MGDLYGHSVGITADPEVSYKELDGTEKFILIGSDGVWDVMTTSDAASLVLTKFQNSKENIAQFIVDECRVRWEMLNNSYKNDNEKSLNLMCMEWEWNCTSELSKRNKSVVMSVHTNIVYIFQWSLHM